LTRAELGLEFRPSLKLRLKVRVRLIEDLSFPVSPEVGGVQVECGPEA
jgi:hypothetical protein